MDRATVYPGQIPLETDVLRTNKFGMIAVAKLAAAMLGTSTVVNGLACVPTSPASLQVNVNPGEMYSLVNVDATAYSSLAADTTHSILKQGISLDAVTLSCPAPATGGQSINYLIQAAYQDADTDNVALPYYNASNPSHAWSGPNDSGTPQSTTRKGAIVISVKAGTAATTGTQLTPSADAGYTGLWVVTVANGQSTITSGNISQAANAPILPSGLLPAIQNNSLVTAGDSGSANTYVVFYTPPITTLVDGMVLWFNAANANTGASTVSINGMTAVPLVGGAHAALQGGEIVAGGKCEIVYKASINSFVLTACTGGALQVGAPTKPSHAVTLGTGMRAVLNAINANTTLTAANMGQSIPIFGAGGITITLPAVSATSAGQRLEFFNYSSGTVTVSCAGADVFVPNGSVNPTSLILGSGDTLVLESLGASAVWYALGGSVQLPYSKAFTTATSGVVGAVRNLKMSVTAASASATLTADEIIVEAALGGLRYCLANFSKTINLATTGAGGMDTGSAPTSGFVALYAIYNPTTQTSALLATNATSAAAPNVYGGANMPSGYTASALVGVWPTNGSGQFVIGTQVDRKFWTSAGSALTTSTQQASPTSLGISSLVPANAKTVGGILALASSSAATLTSTISGSSGSIGQLNCQGQTVSSVSANYEVPLLTSQTIYYTATASAGTMTFSIYVSSYTF